MKSLLIFFIVSTVFSKIFSNPVPQEEISSPQLNELGIKIYLFTRKDTNETQIDLTNSTSLTSTSFDAEKETVFVTHGWSNSHLSPACVVVKNAFLKSADINVFVVDWSNISSLEYGIAQPQVASIGKLLGNLVQSLVSSGLLNLNTTSMVGHSLGAHLVGVAGKVLDGNLKSIVGFDPALPMYTVLRTDNRLNKGDAKFVQVIHTCAGTLGFAVAIGDADYWPNGGNLQPGCESDPTGACSHGRSFRFFAESLISGNFYSYKCNSYADFKAGLCSGVLSYLGEFNLDTTASGSYFLDTNSEEPYAKGK